VRSRVQRPVFYDPTGWRGWWLVGSSWALFTVLGILTACMVLTVSVTPRVGGLKLTPSDRPLAAGRVSPRSHARDDTGGDTGSDTGKATANAEIRRRASDAAANSATRYGYFVNWDENSFPSLKRNAQSLDYVIAGWLHLTGPDGAITQPVIDAIQHRSSRRLLSAFIGQNEHLEARHAE
jgi:peptidoglycan-N-acetylglucosamine deacetylase